MATYEVNVLNPKADKLLRNLADLKLISLTESPKETFLDVVSRLRKRAEKLGVPTLEEITEEVEAVRAEHYAKEKAKNNR